MKPLNFLKRKKLSETNLNKADDHFNRGLEFILSGGKKKRKPFHIIFDNVVCFFNKEIDIYFEFSLNIRNKK